MSVARPRGGWRKAVQKLKKCLDSELAGVNSRHSDLDPSSPDLERYLDLLVEWGAHHDLMAARDADELVDLSLADAYVLATVAAPDQRWVDVGTGAGAPGMPLALLRADLQVTLVEPRVKRVAFLRTVIGSVNAPGLCVVRARSDTQGDGSFEVSVSRATLPPPQWLVEGKRLATDFVWLMLAKSDPPALPGLDLEIDVRYPLPLSGASRRLVGYRRG
ncbi:MAG: class I SAM-dependent methyltransferase [Polyangiaceae bacterium]|nr:class I SAM-dependent methyltransferase [Polyangiaceae bacterium]